MKKALILIFIIPLFFVLFACTSKDTTDVNVTVLEKNYYYSDNGTTRNHSLYGKLNVKVAGCEAKNFRVIVSVEWYNANNGICSSNSYAKDSLVLVDNVTLPIDTNKDYEGLVMWDSSIYECTSYDVSWDWVETNCGD